MIQNEEYLFKPREPFENVLSFLVSSECWYFLENNVKFMNTSVRNGFKTGGWSRLRDNSEGVDMIRRNCVTTLREYVKTFTIPTSSLYETLREAASNKCIGEEKNED